MPKLKTHKGAAKRFKTNRDGKSEAGSLAPAAHSDVEEQETQTESGISGAGQRRRQAQSQAHDSVPVRRIERFRD